MFRQREGECTEKEREIERVCRERGVCREIESAYEGSGRECVCLERGRVYRERERERERDGKCAQREGRSVF